MREITLSQNMVALVDDEDYDFLNQRKWFARRTANEKYYASRNERDAVTKKDKTILMHRLIMNAMDYTEVDHWDNNGLNNQKNNLRFATESQNGINRPKQSNNSSGYKGVYWNKQAQKWMVRIQINKKNHFVGLFSDLIIAARAYDKKAAELFGEFAKLNFE